MGRGSAEFAVIIWGADQPFAEVMLPNPIDHHAGGHGVFRAGHPFSQFLAAAAGGDFRLLFSSQKFWETTLHRLSQPVIPSANVKRYVVNPFVFAFGTAPFLQSVSEFQRRQLDAL